ncbi:hypothetical protein [Raineyella antarctica]|uniref:hypothetical protein n=1 Tax=Raineyella antarctica TaxID=1577474 RepID=UPI001114A656|nr:hypothetical protein [Raineyella antarctica]
MAMSHAERFRLKSQLVDQLSTADWTWQKTNLLLGEFNIDLLGDDQYGPDLNDVLAKVGDPILVELYSVVFEIEESEVTEAIESADTASNWRPGFTRVFLALHNPGCRCWAGVSWTRA